MIGGLQMFDVPQILTNGKGSPNRTVTTVIMYLNNHLYSKNYGMAGAISFVLFLICAVLCICVYFSLNREDNDVKKEKKKLFSAKKKQVRKGEVENAASQLKMS
jgi:multiple sugar transport system permease protein